MEKQKQKRKHKYFTKIPGRAIRRGIILTLAFLLLGVWFASFVRSLAPHRKLSDSTALENLTAIGDYAEFLAANKDVPRPEGVAVAVLGKDGEIAPDSVGFAVGVSSYSPDDGEGLMTSDSGSATWKFTLPQAGLYNILVDYIPETDLELGSSGSRIERKIMINGKEPFKGMADVQFDRVWGDKGEKKTDSHGSEVKPPQTEYPERRQAYIRDSSGFVNKPYLFYFEKGENTLEIISVREAMLIYKLTIVSEETTVSYEEYNAANLAAGYKKVGKEIYATNAVKQEKQDNKIQGEYSYRRSSSTIYAITERGNANNSPAHPVRIILNAIGGDKWKQAGDWIEWKVVVPESGLYNITLRAKQATNRGMYSSRAVLIDGKLPFAEAESAKFRYSNTWNMVTLGDTEKPFDFYLEQGEHTITFLATLGDYGYEIQRIQHLIDELNKIYREIISKIGIAPDKYIDYNLPKKIPHMLSTFEWAAKELRTISREMDEISGEKSSDSATLITVAVQLEAFVKKPYKIQRSLASFSTNLSSLGTWIINVSVQTLTIDYLMVHSPDYKVPKANVNWFTEAWFGIRSFVMSFFFDYSSVGDSSNSEGKAIEVWLLTNPLTGREQGNAIRNIIDTSFTANYNIDLKVVGPEVLLTATLAGKGPDVAINHTNGTPVNYALRGATFDISVFKEDPEQGVKGFDEVVTRFAEAAMVPYFLEDFKPNFDIDGNPVLDAAGNPVTGGYYGLPHRQSFLMTFYRSDIFEQHGWKVPNTWEDVIYLVSELQTKNLQFYLPLNTVGATSIVNQVYGSYLFQSYHGDKDKVSQAFYRREPLDDGTYYLSCNIGSEESQKAFDFWSKFYTDYSFSLLLSGATFINRFRSGEMPIGLANYGTYNTLSVSAPEIKGKWKFAPVPGTEYLDKDGNVQIDRSVPLEGSSMMMMADVMKRGTAKGAWAFMEWWTRKETQIAFAREIESVLGEAARHPTPNKEAFKGLAWNVEEQALLMEQWEQTVGIPEVPGGYYTGRNIENAFRRVVNNRLNPREVLEEYVVFIENEIARKRKEFGLPVAPDKKKKK